MTTYVGGPPARSWTGQHANDSAFDGSAEHVLIEYLTIRNFGTLGGNSQEGVVNHDSGVVLDDLPLDGSRTNGGAPAPWSAATNTLTWNCLQDNQQYGFNAYSNNGEINQPRARPTTRSPGKRHLRL